MVLSVLPQLAMFCLLAIKSKRCKYIPQPLPLHWPVIKQCRVIGRICTQYNIITIDADVVHIDITYLQMQVREVEDIFTEMCKEVVLTIASHHSMKRSCAQTYSNDKSLERIATNLVHIILSRPHETIRARRITGPSKHI